jgi:ABC-2 type transport system ATP-binding protein
MQALMGAVAEHGTTVVLSSHLLGDLERVCDYLIVLQAARVQVLGDVGDLLATHKLLTGPRQEATGIGDAATVVQANHTDKQCTLLVRTNTPFEHSERKRLRRDPEWTVEDLTLEDLVLAYLTDPSNGALPGPAHADLGVAR